MTVPEIIKGITDKGWTLEQIATELGLTKESIYGYLHETRTPKKLARLELDRILIRLKDKKTTEA